MMCFPQYDLANYQYVHTFSRKGEIRNRCFVTKRLRRVFVCLFCSLCLITLYLGHQLMYKKSLVNLIYIPSIHSPNFLLASLNSKDVKNHPERNRNPPFKMKQQQHDITMITITQTSCTCEDTKNPCNASK